LVRVFQSCSKWNVDEKELNQALDLIKKNQTELIKAFNKVKNGQKVTTIKLK